MEHEGAVETGGTVEVQAVPGAADGQPVPGAERPAPGKPPTGLPNGPGVDQWGRTIEYAPEDPSLRTGDINEHPPGDPASTPAGEE